MSDKDFDDMIDMNSSDTTPTSSTMVMSFNSTTGESSTLSTLNQTTVVVDANRNINYNSTTQFHTSGQSLTEVRFTILLYMLVPFMFLMCLRPNRAQQRMFIYEEAELEERQRRRRNNEEKKKGEEMNVEERRKIVDDALVTMIITSCSEQSNGNVITLSSNTQSQSQNQSNTPIYNSDDDETCNACMICLEPYTLHEHVSYFQQSSIQCRHVFHKDCIVDWLMRQDDCPCCRTRYIKQGEEGDVEQGMSKSQPQDYRQETNEVLYIIDGLISKTPILSNCLMHSQPAVVSISNEAQKEGDCEQRDEEKSANNLNIDPPSSCRQQKQERKENIEEDANQSLDSKRKTRRRSFLGCKSGRRAQHAAVKTAAAYTSVSIHDDGMDHQDLECNSNDRKKEKKMEFDDSTSDDKISHVHIDCV